MTGSNVQAAGSATHGLTLETPDTRRDGGPTELAAATARPQVTAVMPCLNEARTLPACIRKAQQRLSELGITGEVVVADNGSTDGSPEIAATLGARVVHEPRRGYGAALQAGIAAAEGEIIVMADCDESYDWGEIGRFAAKIDEGYDLVVGNRFKGGIDAGAMPLLHRYFGNPALSLISRLVFKIPVGDFHCGMRAFTRSALERMKPRTTGMEFATEMLANAGRGGLRITEIPIRLHPDRRDRRPHLRSFRDGWRHLRFIVTYAPDQLYLWPGLSMLLAGIALMALLASGPFSHGHLHLGIHFLILGGLLALLGLNVTVMGLLAKIAVAYRFPASLSPFLQWFTRAFRLERGLVAGGLLACCGLAVDSAILWRWIDSGGAPMDDTVHPAIVATIAIALGISLIFGSFMTQLLLEDERHTGWSGR